MDRLVRTEAMQCQLKKHAHRHRKAARAAAKDKDAAQATRADDLAVLIGLQEQLDAARAEAFTTTCQWILANNRAALAEVARDRAKAEVAQQARVEWDLHHQLAHAQNVVVDL